MTAPEHGVLPRTGCYKRRYQSTKRLAVSRATQGRPIGGRLPPRGTPRVARRRTCTWSACTLPGWGLRCWILGDVTWGLVRTSTPNQRKGLQTGGSHESSAGEIGPAVMRTGPLSLARSAISEPVLPAPMWVPSSSRKRVILMGFSSVSLVVAGGCNHLPCDLHCDVACSLVNELRDHRLGRIHGDGEANPFGAALSPSAAGRFDRPVHRMSPVLVPK